MCKHTSPPWRWEQKLLGNVRVCNQRDSRRLRLGATSTHAPCVATQLLHTKTSLSSHLRPSNFSARLVAPAVQPQLCSEPRQPGEASWHWPPVLQSAPHQDHPDPGTAATHIYAKQALCARASPGAAASSSSGSLLEK